MKSKSNIDIKIGVLYSAQFCQHPAVRILEDLGNECYKIELYPYNKLGDPVIREVEEYFVKMMCYREYDPFLQTQEYTGPITKEDLECVQGFFDDLITEDMVRRAIKEYNWGGDWNEVLSQFSIDGDTCNREFVVKCVNDFYNLKSI